ncbi:hypothetical protein CEP53_013456 [Fusarium sp. AF-6]|nr:hypothetical protein CEP53_013456 [Fusarium sp. AF-6]
MCYRTCSRASNKGVPDQHPIPILTDVPPTSLPGPPCSLFFFNISFCFALDLGFPLSAGLVPLLILPFRITSPQSAESLVRHRVR